MWSPNHLCCVWELWKCSGSSGWALQGPEHLWAVCRRGTRMENSFVSASEVPLQQLREFIWFLFPFLPACPRSPQPQYCSGSGKGSLVTHAQKLQTLRVQRGHWTLWVLWRGLSQLQIKTCQLLPTVPVQLSAHLWLSVLWICSWIPPAVEFSEKGEVAEELVTPLNLLWDNGCGVSQSTQIVLQILLMSGK